MLFSGPRGVGKTSVARILAKSLNCESGPAKDPCNNCNICAQITAGSCVDVNEIDGASNRGIDEIRQLREEIRFQPVQCRFRIYIIDEVHMLTNEAFNALLKTLEEPPPHAYFIFATTEPRKIPETIHSRCQHYEFRRLSETDLSTHLDRIIKKEEMGIPRRATMLLAREARGSVRDSLSLLDQVAAFGARNYDEVCQALGVAGLAKVEELAYAILKSDIEEAVSIIDTVHHMGVDLERIAQDLLKFLRDLSLIKKVPQKNAATLTEYHVERIEDLKKTFSGVPFGTILHAMETLASGMDSIYRSPTPRISLEILLMKMCCLSDFVHIDKVIDRLERLLLLYESKEASGPDSEPRPSVADVPQRESQDKLKDYKPKPEKYDSEEDETIGPGEHDDSVERWRGFVDFVKKQSPGLGSALDACIKVEFGKTGEIDALCSNDFRGEMLLSRDRASQINNLASRFFKRPVNINFRLEKRPSFHQQEGDRAGNGHTKTNLRDELIQNTLVQEAINTFQARISNVTLYNRHNKKRS